MPTTRLFIECPHCHQQYILKKAPLTYSNGAYIENVADPEWQRLLCPCRPNKPYRFRFTEKSRFQVVSAGDSELTHFLSRKPKSN